MTITYDNELINLCHINNVNLPSLNTLGGKALAWMSQPHMRGGNNWIHRDEENPTHNIVSGSKIIDELGMQSKDVIQCFNKERIVRLDKSKGQGYYSLKYPFELIDLQKRSNVKMNVLENGTKENQIKSVKKYQFNKLKTKMEDCERFMRLYKLDGKISDYNRFKKETGEIKWVIEHILDVPTERWHIGHLVAHPPKEANDSSNLYYQPPIQSKFTDKYTFNIGFDKIRVKA